MYYHKLKAKTGVSKLRLVDQIRSANRVFLLFQMCPLDVTIAFFLHKSTAWARPLWSLLVFLPPLLCLLTATSQRSPTVRHRINGPSPFESIQERGFLEHKLLLSLFPQQLHSGCAEGSFKKKKHLIHHSAPIWNKPSVYIVTIQLIFKVYWSHICSNYVTHVICFA